ncbi:MAG: FAD-dependent monooxygenase [Gemmatimonadota bacterium]|nr:FAD-dependent monooxygenase [Gemmatimonadota bacterium]
MAKSAASDIFIINDILRKKRKGDWNSTHAAGHTFTMKQIPVLIAGAGPTGLVLALWLTKSGIAVRIVDKTAEAGTTSRALGVQAHTLELYRQMGIADGVLQGCVRIAGANFWISGKRVARIDIREIGTGLSPFPGLVTFAQDEHEKMLIAELTKVGVTVERQTELLKFDDRGTSIVATLRLPDGSEEQCEASYLAGCDGAHSAVRAGLGIGFPGGTYDALFYVADAQATGSLTNDEVHFDLSATDFLAVFPLKGAGRVRLIGTVKAITESEEKALTFDDVGVRALREMKLTVDMVNWFSTYRVHHRVAEHFRKGRAFILGDAAHIHSPVGAQGMNTGIGDAINLAWKLAAVLTGDATPRILDSFETERIGFARRLVATTDKIFTIVSKPGWSAAFLRTRLMPLIVPMLFRIHRMRTYIFRTVSQIGIKYRESALSSGKAGKLAGGDRLPWVPTDGDDDNFTPLTSMAWQAHIYGEVKQSATAACAELQLPLHVFPWSPAAEHAGLLRSAFYLVRPDGYIALADADSGALRLRGYLSTRGLSVGAR